VSIHLALDPFDQHLAGRNPLPLAGLRSAYDRAGFRAFCRLVDHQPSVSEIGHIEGTAFSRPDSQVGKCQEDSTLR
jgi:hypothetical protein